MPSLEPHSEQDRAGEDNGEPSRGRWDVWPRLCSEPRERADILEAMRQSAENGRPLGAAQFEQITGIARSDWGHYWPRIGDVQRDAGFEPNQKIARRGRLDLEAAQRHLRGPAWVRSDLPLELLRQLLGLSSIEATLPYARLLRGSLDGRMAKLDTLFTDLVRPADIAA